MAQLQSLLKLTEQQNQMPGADLYGTPPRLPQASPKRDMQLRETSLLDSNTGSPIISRVGMRPPSAARVHGSTSRSEDPYDFQDSFSRMTFQEKTAEICSSLAGKPPSSPNRQVFRNRSVDSSSNIYGSLTRNTSQVGTASVSQGGSRTPLFSNRFAQNSFSTVSPLATVCFNPNSTRTIFS
ncbi:hypothetical protein Ciccas_011689 [Cichlidogyrus casuarinus]|uniref:Uncharacterized protein n=1 Tax=Cichlidogyrus casuarinus TaxID=1844966 RepID=A0ABD2PRF6_9PLAT